MEGLSGVPLAADPAELSQAATAPACSIVIFGAAGDLTRRLLMPAIYNLRVAGLLPDSFRVIGVDRLDEQDEAFRDRLGDTMQHFVAERSKKAVPLDHAAWEWLRSRISYAQGDFDDPATYERLTQRLGEVTCSAVFYLAVADRFFASIVERLSEASLTVQTPDCFRRVVIEKPFGHDLGSARALNARLLKVLDEDQIFRIDHYLGKETVQNILALRFSNGLFEPIWKRDNIDHVQITVAETVGVERRGKFYESAGALRDMVPNHLFQLLSMVAMEAPTSFDADAVRDERTKVLNAVHPLGDREALRHVIRGQYRAGIMGGEMLPGYRQEPDVDPNSSTETFVALKLGIDNWRWAGVPFYIRTGKRLAQRKSEIAIHFKQAPFALFRDTPVDKLAANVLVLHIQPQESVSLQFSAKVPGPTVRLGGVRMDFNYEDYFNAGPSTGYETLLYDCLIGDATLFQRADNVEAGWRIVQPALDAWQAGHIHVHPYSVGSAGPAKADALLAEDGRHWRRLG